MYFSYLIVGTEIFLVISSTEYDRNLFFGSGYFCFSFGYYSSIFGYPLKMTKRT
jgi:hypothetical protein